MEALVIMGVTVICMIACVIMNAEIKKIKLPLYWVVTLVGAITVLAGGFLPLPTAIAQLTANTAVNPLKILVLFLCMTMLSVFLDEAGFFRYLAGVTLKKAGHKQMTLFVTLYFVVSILTVFTSNDVIILTFTPFICYFCKSAKINPLPYLIAEFVGANTFSMTLLIGNPTNVYLALAENISFVDYLSVMWLPSLFGGITAFLVMLAIFYKKLCTPITPSFEHFPLKKSMVIIGLIHLSTCTVLLALSDFIGVEMWLISLLSALSLFIIVSFYKLIKREHFVEITHTIHRAPWGLIPFMLSMFIMVCALNEAGLTSSLASLLNLGEPVFTYGIVSALTCNVVNNIPMSVLFGSVLSFSQSLPSAFACIIGSNIGAFITPIGALAGIMWSNILRAQKVKLSFLKFVFYGVIIAIPTLLASLFGLFIII